MDAGIKLEVVANRARIDAGAKFGHRERRNERRKPSNGLLTRLSRREYRPPEHSK
jgi:hypothetical protein